MAAIRRATHDDISRIVEIRAEVRENRLSDPTSVLPEHVRWFVDHPGIWVWEENGRVLGFAAADTRDGSIWALFVDPASEGRGIGRALLARACDVLREAGYDRAVLSTGPGTRAERLYLRDGWTRTGTLPNGDVVMTRAL